MLPKPRRVLTKIKVSKINTGLRIFEKEAAMEYRLTSGFATIDAVSSQHSLAYVPQDPRTSGKWGVPISNRLPGIFACRALFGCLFPLLFLSEAGQMACCCHHEVVGLLPLLCRSPRPLSLSCSHCGSKESVVKSAPPLVCSPSRAPKIESFSFLPLL